VLFGWSLFSPAENPSAFKDKKIYEHNFKNKNAKTFAENITRKQKKFKMLKKDILKS